MTFKPKSDQAGFTLVEMLVAMFIFSLISAGTMAALTSSLNGKAQLKTRLDHIAQLETSRALMRSDFDALVLRVNREPYGNVDEYMMSGGAGAQSLFSFTRSGRENPTGLEPRGDIQHVDYVLENGDLLRRAMSQANPAPNSPVIDRVLVSGLSAVEVFFETGTQRDAQLFIDAKDRNPKTPDRATFNLEFENGDRLTHIFEIGL